MLHDIAQDEDDSDDEHQAEQPGTIAMIFGSVKSEVH